jgi:site-specific DNA-cytosine methylase
VLRCRNTLPELDANASSHPPSGRKIRRATAILQVALSGCFNPSKGRFLHPEKNRAITMREAALLQGFPRDYIFDLSAGKEAIALMIGNALPPEFIRRHALEIRSAIRRRTR